MTSLKNLDGIEILVFNGCVYFDDWLKAKGYLTQSTFREIAWVNGYSEDVIQAELDVLENEFNEWAEANGVQPETC